nr:carboxypeptidase regulatory-like domain-containing protein [Bryobacter sp.]
MIRGFISIILFTACLLAQDFRATLTGRVTDITGAAIPNVVVTVRNVGTNEAATVSTDGQGNYVVPLLRPGQYTVAVDNAAGFKKFLRENITLIVGQTAVINIALELGALSEQVTVTAETPMLESAKADRGTVILNKQVNELPLNARNPFMLSALVVGVNYNGNAIYQRPFDNGAIADWSINGSRNRNNEFLLDGAPNNAQAGGNNLAYVPPVDSVQEFKIQTNSFDAQYGKTGGGVVNVTLKSGTNDLHGTAYEFMRRRWLDANSFQNNSRAVERSNHYLDQYGGLLSGPVILPKLYNGKDKTFFMVNYEGYREGTPNPINASVPAPEFFNGDFSRLRNPLGQQITIYDPTTGREVGGTWTRTPFAGNLIPANRINPISRRILGYYPAPNATSPALDYSRGNLFISPNIATDDFYNFTVKIDQNLGARHRFFFRHASNDRTETRTTNGIKGGPGEDGPLPLKRINDAYVIDWVSTLSPNLIFNIRPSFSRYVEGARGDGNGGFNLTDLGFPKSLQDSLPTSGYFGRYEFSDYLPLGRYFNFNYTNTVAVHPTLTWIKGAHTLK